MRTSWCRSRVTAVARTSGGPTASVRSISRARSAACSSSARMSRPSTWRREALHLINEELKHRVKNTLAVLGAVATQTFRDASSKADLEKYQGRLAAFARAHDLLTAANWAAAPLQDVISTALIPYRTGEGRFSVSGPSLVVKSRQALALSLAIHELATNALKYGALTVPNGRVSITWTCEDQEGEPKFVFVWRELGGPRCVSTRRRRLWLAADFPGPARRFQRRRRNIVWTNRAHLPPDGPLRKHD